MAAIHARRRPSIGITDSDVAAYLTTTGINEPGLVSDITWFVGAMKSAGLWSKMYAIYPLLGGTAPAHRVDMKVPTRTGLTYTGTVAHSSNGIVGDGTTGFANTGIAPPMMATGLGYTLSFYTNSLLNPSTGDFVDMGTLTSTTAGLHISAGASSSAGRAPTARAGSPQVTSATTAPTGMHTIVFTTSFAAVLDRNGVQTATASGAAVTFSAEPVYLLTLNYLGTPYGRTTRPLQYAAIAYELSAADRLAHYNIVQELQTRRGRAA